MHWTRKLYRTKNMAFYGLVTLFLLILFMIAGWCFIPDFEPDSKRQMSYINGTVLKYNDQELVSDFFQSINNNHGYLCLGTSETTSLPYGNYYNFLQNDPDLNGEFTALGGAGRTCGVYLPILMSHKDNVRGLNLIYLINPVYWRTDLCHLDDKYWKRYIHINVCKNIQLTGKDDSMYNVVVQPYYDKVNPGQSLIYTLEYQFRKLRSNFFTDLNYWIDSSKYYLTRDYLPADKTPLNVYKNFGCVDTLNLDTTYNIDKSFVSKKWLNNINTEVDYRYKELKSFIYFCKKLDIRVIFVVGPYNKQFIERENPSYLKAYVETVNHIRETLMDQKVQFIDASDISDVQGAFHDNQHHSSYGAYLIYEKIKSYLNEKNTH